ncbi:hypothetical protein [Ensifer adhaerens]
MKDAIAGSVCRKTKEPAAGGAAGSLKIDQQPGRRSGADLVNDPWEEEIVHRIEALREEMHCFDEVNIQGFCPNRRRILRKPAMRYALCAQRNTGASVQSRRKCDRTAGDAGETRAGGNGFHAARIPTS